MTPPLSRRAAITLLSAAITSPAFAGVRPADWAVPVALEGVPNLHRITPQLYRAAQPTGVGFQNLAGLGIRTVISLRQTVDDGPLAEGTGLVLHRVPMKSRNVGEDVGAKVVAVLRLVTRAEGPVLIHCHHGADRTGAISAVYRMGWQGWTHDAALDELLHGGYGFHAVWRNIPRYVAGVDAADVRHQVDAG